jgi:outer membrane protein OmpA-like peptidoglycan-associated protein
MAEIVKYYTGTLHAQFQTGKVTPVYAHMQTSGIQLHGRFQLERPHEISAAEFEAHTLTPPQPYLQQQMHAPVELLYAGQPVKAAVLKEATLLWSEDEMKDGTPWTFLAVKNNRRHGRMKGRAYCKVVEHVPDPVKPIDTVVKTAATPTTATPTVTPIATDAAQPTSIGTAAVPPVVAAPPTQSLSGCSPLSWFKIPGFGGGCRNLGCGMLILIPLLFVLLGLLKQCQDNGAQRESATIIHDTIYVDRVKDRVDTLTLFKTDTIQMVDSSKQTVFKPVVLPNVQFYTNSANLIPTSLSDIQQLAQHLIDTPGLDAIVIGHTDNVGDAISNQKLSQRRAETVRNVIISMGVEPERLTAIGKGDTEPKADNNNEEGRLMNRRVEVQLVQHSITETKTTVKP